MFVKTEAARGRSAAQALAARRRLPLKARAAAHCSEQRQLRRAWAGPVAGRSTDPGRVENFEKRCFFIGARMRSFDDFLVKFLKLFRKICHFFSFKIFLLFF